MCQRRKILARNTLDDESTAQRFLAKPWAGHRSIGKRQWGCRGQSNGIVGIDVASACWGCTHYCTFAGCSTLRAWLRHSAMV